MIMFARYTTACFALLISAGLIAQVVTDKPIILVGADPIDRQVAGLPPSTEPQAVLTTAVEQAGTYRTTFPASGNTWSLDLPGLGSAPQAGTHLLVIAPEPVAGSISIVLNGAGPFALLTGPNEAFDGSMVTAGTPLSVVFDGSAFQIMNGANYATRPCAVGTVAVNSMFCVEPIEHPGSDFFEAMTTCHASGLRLCSWGEFVVACQREVELGLVGTTNSWEWTGDASNENGSARIVGVGSCFSAGNALVTGSLDRTFRCCYSR